MIVHTLKMCTYYFFHISQIFFFILGVLNLDIFSIQNAKVVSGLCNMYLKQFDSLIFKLEHVHLLFGAHLINIFLFLGWLNLENFFIRKA